MAGGPTPIILNGNNSPWHQLAAGAGSSLSNWAEAYAQQKLQEKVIANRKKNEPNVPKGFTAVWTGQNWQIEEAPEIKGKPFRDEKTGLILQENNMGGYDIIQQSTPAKPNYEEFWDEFGDSHIIDTTTQAPKETWTMQPPDKTTGGTSTTIGIKSTAEYDQSYRFLEEQLGRKPTEAEIRADMDSRKTDTSTTAEGQWDTLTETAKEGSVKNWILTGKFPERYYRDKDYAVKFTDYAYNFLNAKGITVEEMASIRSQVKGLQSSMSFQEKQRGATESFVININEQVTRFKKIAEELVDRIGIRAADVPRRKLVKDAIGSANENIITMYNTEISNEIAKLSTSSQASIRELSAYAQERWKKIHDDNLSVNQMIEILDETQHLASIRKQSIDDALRITTERYDTLIDSKMGNETQISTTISELPHPQTQEEFDALSKGTHYIDPEDGKEYIK